MYEQDAGLKVLFALPGIRADQIEVVIDAAGIVVRGWRTPTWAAAPAVIQRIEIPYGRFERRVTLPPGTFRLASQTLQDGCLTLVLQRT